MDKILPWSDLLPQIMPFTSCIIQVSCSAQGGGGGSGRRGLSSGPRCSVLRTPYSPNGDGDVASPDNHDRRPSPPWLQTQPIARVGDVAMLDEERNTSASVEDKRRKELTAEPPWVGRTAAAAM